MVAERDFLPQLPDDLVLELCTRLPTKKLVQCMSVTKVWHSIIRHPSFTEACRSRNRCILVAHRPSNKHSFYYCSMGVDEAEQFVNPYNFNLKDCNGNHYWFTKVVNGLVCAYNSDHVFVCSIWTGETIQLPDPPRIQDDEDTSVHFDYFFGFDPVDGLYKLLATKKSVPALRIDDEPVSYKTSFSYHILTLGGTDSSWRELNNSSNVPAEFRHMQSFMVNGVFYWLTDKKEIIAFNLNEEKFRFIHPPKIDENRFDLCKFTQFRGRLALFYPVAHIKLIIYTLDDHEGITWTKNETIYPNELKCRLYTRVVPLPRGDVLLVNGEAQGCFTPVYSYNYENNKFEKFVVGKWPHYVDVIDKDRVYISCEVPNFTSIDDLLRGCSSIK